jgi:Protein of unknown function (DUF2380)
MHRANCPRVAEQTKPSRRRMTKIAVAAVGAAVLLVSQASNGRSAAPLMVAVADFDYVDTSGEVRDQSAEHSARVAAFANLLRENLGSGGDYSVKALECPDHPCTAGRMAADDFAAAARQSGARLIVYGGIRKMSTLVQWGEIQLLDLDSNRLLLQRTVTFRGDTDTAYSRAAAFVGDALKDAMPKP